MALNKDIISVLHHLKKHGVITASPRILDVGEQNWYGDVALSWLRHIIDEIAVLPEHRDFVEKTWEEVKAMEDKRLSLKDESKLLPLRFRLRFKTAKLFYKVIFSYDHYHTIDLHGYSEGALPFNLNEPLPEHDALKEGFDIVLDFGTLEHVFNISQAFRSIHDLTNPGGLMIHALPHQGFYDHGFFNIQPTLFYDIASANNYGIEAFFMSNTREDGRLDLIPIIQKHLYMSTVQRRRIGKNAMLICALRKREQSAFQVPMQNVYSEATTEQTHKNWLEATRGALMRG